jgi:hypothetical protein
VTELEKKALAAGFVREEFVRDGPDAWSWQALEFRTAGGHCGLCGNWGYIDRRGLKTPGGEDVGEVHHCICPAGRQQKRHDQR